ncbi:HET-domain-containing protein [Teratosphaeria destructans]|uniref:HET-domain-containing protein n=1 Tax=Teratosphaeria destructans TaxID=418781 RepID=A0A9W7SSA3_9PEZI|nr:HET-domain-containing protein [Teratosphaeria destructans]
MDICRPMAREHAELYKGLLLDPSQQHIRILRLAPGSHADPLRCTLQVVSLASPSPAAYQATSYTWGTDAPAHDIEIGSGKMFKIRKNLDAVLRGLRSRRVSMDLWTDALCINQEDLAERSSQVAMMGTIYAKATRVLIWLGAPTQKITLRRHLFRTINNSLFSGVDARVKAKREYKHYAPLIESAIDSTQPRWSERQWVIQEMVLAQEAFICFGHIWLRFDRRALVDMLLAPGMPHMPNLLALNAATSDMASLKAMTALGEQDIAEAALWGAQATCTDPRDKVYSLVSMIYPEEAEIIGSDYTRSVGQVFARATFASMTVLGNLDILRLVDFVATRDPKIPTWAVDFTTNRLPASRVDIHGTAVHRGRKPDHSLTKSRQTFKLKSTCGFCLLQLCGTRVDEIVDTLCLPLDSSEVVGTPLADALVRFVQNAFARGLIDPSLWNQRDLNLDKRALSSAAGSDLLETYPHQGHVRARPLFEHFQSWWRTQLRFLDQQTQRHEPSDVDWDTVADWQYCNRVANGVRALITRSGLLGFGPETVDAGDIIILGRGSRLPLALRRHQKHNNDVDLWMFRGLCSLPPAVNNDYAAHLAVDSTEEVFVLR